MAINQVVGTTASETLQGTPGDDNITAGSGNDTIVGSFGNDTIHGGSGGSDILTYVGSAVDHVSFVANVTMQSGLPAAQAVVQKYDAAGQLLGTDTATYVERLAGTSGTDDLADGAAIIQPSGSELGMLLDLAVGTLKLSGNSAGTPISQTPLATWTLGVQGIEHATGTAYADALTGNAGANNLQGGAGNDTLVGGAGDDTLIGGVGADELKGGEGTDLADYSASSAAVLVNLATGSGLGGDAQGDTLTEIENLTGSAHNDTLVGGDGANDIRAGFGVDSVEGGAGADTLDGGLGEDYVSYAGSSVGVNVDLKTGVVSGGDATGDSITGFEHLTGSAHADTLVGTDDGNVLTGGGGDDWLFGGLGNDTIGGGAGNDIFVGSASGSDAIKAGDGTDTLDYSEAGVRIEYGVDSVDGDRVTAFVKKYDENGNLLGTDKAVGFEAIKAGGGTGDVVDGASFSALDPLFSFLLGSPAKVGLDVNVGTGQGGILVNGVVPPGTDLAVDISGFEIFKGSDGVDRILGGTHAGALTIEGADGDDTLEGGAGADTIDGGAGNDTVRGGAGDDLLSGGSGSNLLDGGDGVDTADYSGSDSEVIVDLAEGSASNWHDDDQVGRITDTLTSIEHVVGSSYDDTLIGSAGADSLEGADGDDLFAATAGADTLDGGSGFDIVFYSTGEEGGAGVVVSLDSEVQSEGAAAEQVLRNIEGLVGTRGDDWLIGDVTPENHYNIGTYGYDGGRANLLVGLDGDDTLDGGMGDDTLIGGTGSNLLVGGEGNDTAVFGDRGVFFGEGDASGPVTVRLDLGYAETVREDGSERDDLISIENVVGTEFGDLIIGDAEENVLWGDDGNDTLEGGAGGDHLEGGAGRDMASYAHAAAGVTAALAETHYDLNGVNTFNVPNSPNTGDARGDTYESVEDLEGSAYADALYGNSEGNLVRGLGGKDALYGLAGDDMLEGGLGADAMNGGAGFDMASYEHAASGVKASLVSQRNALDGGAQDEARQDSYVSVEGLRGSGYADQLVGNTGANLLQGLGGDDTFDGGAGNDTLEGGAGADSLLGGLGSDTLEGGVGADTLNGGDGVDLVSYAHSEQGVTVNLAAGMATGGEAQGDKLLNIENVLGSNYADRLKGGAGANLLMGGQGDDTLSGGAGADTLDGGAGTDTVTYAGEAGGIMLDLEDTSASTGAAAGDVFCSIESVIGTDGNDTLRGSSAANLLDGGLGNDLIEGRGGSDTLIGGAGRDTVSYASHTEGVIVDLGTGSGRNGNSTEQDSLSGFEDVIGGQGNDLITGSSVANRIEGGVGSDTLHGLEGADTILGGEGADSLLGGADTDQLFGGEGCDTLEGGLGNDTLDGGAASDTLLGGEGSDTLDGGAGSNLLDGGAGQDRVDYSASDAAAVSYRVATGKLERENSNGVTVGTDTLVSIENLVATTGSDDWIDGWAETRAMVLNLGTGSLKLGSESMSARGFENAIGGTLSDSITGTAGANYLQGLQGDDTLSGLAGNDELLGDGGADSLLGGEGADTLSGGEGDDVLIGGAGADILNGGLGVDTANYSASTGAVTVSLASGQGTGGDAEGDTLSDVQNLIGTGLADSLTGDALANLLQGGAGHDTLSGGEGADTIQGGTGDDVILLGSAADFAVDEVIDGGSGTDVIRYTADVTGQLTLTSGVTGIEEVRLSNAGGATTGTAAIDVDATALAAGLTITLTGNDGANRLTGNDDGANRLFGGAGADTLIGGALSDTLVGGAGADSLVGGDGQDWADYSSSQLGVSVNLKDQVQALGDASGDLLVGIENVIGSVAADFLRGDAGANIIVGGAGNDSIQGFEGNDILEGGLGADEMIGGDGIDLATYRSATTGVVVDMLFTLTATGEALGDTFLGIENLEGSASADTLAGNNLANGIWGGAGNDKLLGAGGNDTLIGGDGADTLIGGAGTDRLSGGAGADRFVFTSTADTSTVSTSWDVISDWNTGDLIDLSMIDANTGLAGEQDFTFMGTRTSDYSNAPAGELHIHHFGGNTYVVGGINGNVGRDFVIEITGHHSLTASDFILS